VSKHLMLKKTGLTITAWLLNLFPLMKIPNKKIIFFRMRCSCAWISDNYIDPTQYN